MCSQVPLWTGAKILIGTSLKWIEPTEDKLLNLAIKAMWFTVNSTRLTVPQLRAETVLSARSAADRNRTGTLLTTADVDKSPGSPTVALKPELVQLQFCICPSLMCMEVALAVICQWLIRCGRSPLCVLLHWLGLCIYRKMAVLGGEHALFTCNINTLTSTRVTIHYGVTTGKTRNKKWHVLVGAEFMHQRINKQAYRPYDWAVLGGGNHIVSRPSCVQPKQQKE